MRWKIASFLQVWSVSTFASCSWSLPFNLTHPMILLSLSPVLANPKCQAIRADRMNDIGLMIYPTVPWDTGRRSSGESQEWARPFRSLLLIRNDSWAKKQIFVYGEIKQQQWDVDCRWDSSRLITSRQGSIAVLAVNFACESLIQEPMGLQGECHGTIQQKDQ